MERESASEVWGNAIAVGGYFDFVYSTRYTAWTIPNKLWTSKRLDVWTIGVSSDAVLRLYHDDHRNDEKL